MCYAVHLVWIYGNKKLEKIVCKYTYDLSTTSVNVYKRLLFFFVFNALINVYLKISTFNTSMISYSQWHAKHLKLNVSLYLQPTVLVLQPCSCAVLLWAFFRKPEKLGSHTRRDPDVKDDPNDPLTRWPNDAIPCLLTTPLSGMIFHRQGRTCYDKSTYQIWSL